MRGLQAIFGSKTAERVLLYMQNYGEGYSREIATAFDAPVSQVKKQLDKFEDGGLIVSRQFGRVRLYSWNKSNPLVGPLRELLEQALRLLPDDETQRYYRARKRPRRSGKPL